MLNSVQAQTPYYYLNRSFTPVDCYIGGTPTIADLYAESEDLTETVLGAPVVINSNETYAIEKQTAITICYDLPMDAWNAAVNYNGTSSNYLGKIFDNVGWVLGTKNTGNDWGAYLWVIQNRIAFQSSTSEWWVLTNNLPVVITNVMVGSLGDYGPVSNVVDIGPSIPTNYPGANQNDSGVYQVDITNVCYQLSIPDIWIMPRYAVTNVGGSNVQYTVTGTNIPQGVTWTLIPDLSGSGGAAIQTNSDWHYREVIPGNVATNYKVRATSVDNTNFYDQVDLMVVGLQSPLQYKIGTNTWADIPDPLYVCKDTTVNFKVIKIPTNASWPNGKPVWGGVVSGSGVETNFYTFSTVSTNDTDYKIVSAECGNTMTGKVIVIDLELTTTKGYGIWWFNGEDAENYDESGTLTAQGVTEGTFQWDVIAGTNTVDLYKYGQQADTITETNDNYVIVKATGASDTDDDVIIRFTYNGNEICQYSLAVRTPDEEVETNLIHVALSFGGATNGYDSKHEFVVIDQLGEDLPANVYLNEHWTESAQNDYTPNNNWGEVEAENWQYPGTNTDHLWAYFVETNDIPNTMVPQTPLGNVKVLHFNGEHYIGSSTEGHGVKVLMKKWQYYQDHGRRE